VFAWLALAKGGEKDHRRSSIKGAFDSFADSDTFSVSSRPAMIKS
jgi:hypothetical protein